MGKWSRRLAFSLDGLRGDPRRILDWAAASGFTGVELPLHGKPVGMADLDRSGTRDLRSFLSDRNLVLASVSGSLPGALDHPNGADQAVHALERVLERLALTGRSPLVLEIEPLGVGEEASDEVLSEALERMRELTEHYEYPVALVGHVLDVKRIAEALDGDAAPFVGIGFDPLRILEVEGDASIWLEQWGKRLHVVYVEDGVPHYGLVNFARVGDGAIPWYQVFEKLEELDYAGPLVIRTARATDPYEEAVRAKRFVERI
ncbi:MAG: sugar phosphate isomerase/epimerase [Calditrichaeota bacterium]|nr:sugar phosphate isomerase/epimerase [Calditrichota bacterium]